MRKRLTPLLLINDDADTPSRTGTVPTFEGVLPLFPHQAPTFALSRACPPRSTAWAVSSSGDDRGKRARQRGRAESGLYQSVLFPSPRWKQPQNPSPTFARKPRAIVQKCTGQKSFRAKVRRVQRPSRPFFVVPAGDEEKGFRVTVPVAQEL